jgi:flagellar motility protein MotE (MotC chaperone)
VSDKLAEIILNMIGNIQPTKQNLESLKTTERQLFDLLIYVSGLSKKINTKKDDNIDELKERLKLVEAQIRAGNDNPITKNELKGIVHKLQLYNCISMNNAKSYLKQF